MIFTREALEAELQGTTGGEEWEDYCRELYEAHISYIKDNYKGAGNYQEKGKTNA